MPRSPVRLALALILAPALCAGAADTPRLGWTTDLAKMKAPDAPAFGKLQGQDFKVEGAQLAGNGALTLRQGKDLLPDLAIIVFLPLKPGKSIEARSYQFGAEKAPGETRPAIHVQRKPPGEALPKGQAYPDGYALKLDFGKSQNDRVTGKIYLCLPDEGKSFVAGTFTLELK